MLADEAACPKTRSMTCSKEKWAILLRYLLARKNTGYLDFRRGV